LTQGFGIAPLEFYWGGTPHASVSYRTADTRAGGSLLNIEDYAEKIISTFGLGMGNYEQIYTELAGGGAYYQKHIRKPRNFSMLLHFKGDNPGDLHDNRNTIIEAIRPDYTGYDQPLIIRYQGEDSDGDEATNPVDIVCIPQPGLGDIPERARNNQAILNFTVLNGTLNGAYKEGLELGLYDTLPVGDYLVYRDKDGKWHDVDNSGTGIQDGGVLCLIESPNGDIIAGGEFEDAGLVANADNLFKWTGSAIEAVTGSDDFGSVNASVWALCYDAEGNLYIGGKFDNAGDSNGDGIVKWDGSNLSSLGTGVDDSSTETVLCIAIEPNTGDIYAGGTFDGMGGVANTAKIAYWDISASVWKPLDTGLNGLVYALAFAPNGDLYIGGAFTNADGANGDYICYWDGSAFNMLGDTELSATVRDLTFDKNGLLYACGDFINAGGDANADGVAMFNNNCWQGLGEGVESGVTIKTLYIDENNLYIGGDEYAPGSFPDLSLYLSMWKNGAWGLIDVAPPTGATVSDIIKTSTGDLFVAGSYDGTTVVCDQKTVTNNGNTAIYPTIEILGPGVLQSITNYTTGKGITFDGLTLQDGEIITLKLDPTNIDMKSDWVGRGDLMQYVNPGSDLGSFHLKPGDNYINLFMSSGTDGNTKAYIYFTPKFWNLEGSRYE